MASTAETNALSWMPTTPDIGSRLRPRKRALTEARREQNRLNQRTYRQKQRAQRLQGLHYRCKNLSARKLKMLPQPTNHTPEDTIVTRKPAPGLENTVATLLFRTELAEEQRTTVSLTNDVAIPHDELPLPPIDFGCPLQVNLQPIIDLENINELLTDQPFTIGPPFSSACSSLTSIPSNFEFSCPRPSADLAPSDLSTSSETIYISDENEISPRTLEALDSEESSTAAQGWSPTQDIPLWGLTSPPDVAAEFRSDDHRRYQNVPGEGMVNQSIDIDRVIAAGLEVLLYDRQPAAASQNILSPPHLPSPRMNCIQFLQTKILQACIQNALSMGFLVQDALLPRCLASSPFHRPITPADDPRKLLAAVTRPSTPLHLKPTLPQVLYPHPAFMDLIPMPAFRARAITLAATQPQSLNIWELKKDMIVEDGLTLWSSIGSGASSGAIGEGQGQPWDKRSWEAAPWFLRKWRILFDGEEEEVWKQSLWWRRARGEVEDRVSSDI